MRVPRGMARDPADPNHHRGRTPEGVSQRGGPAPSPPWRAPSRAGLEQRGRSHPEMVPEPLGSLGAGVWRQPSALPGCGVWSVFKAPRATGAGDPNGSRTGCWAPPATTDVTREEGAQTSPSRIPPSATQQGASKGLAEGWCGLPAQHGPARRAGARTARGSDAAQSPRPSTTGASPSCTASCLSFPFWVSIWHGDQRGAMLNLGATGTN